MTIRMTARAVRAAATTDAAEKVLRKFILATIKKITSKSTVYPTDHKLYDPIERDAAKSASTQILHELHKGPKTNRQLSYITLRYGARIADLRAAGHNIETTKLASRLYLYEIVF